MGKKNLTPYVDIIVPNYNKGKYLKEAINSVINQTYKRFNLPLKYIGEVEVIRTSRMIRNLQVYFITPRNNNI